MLVDHILIRRDATRLGCAPQPELLRELGTRLRGHVHLEEHSVFPLIDETLPEHEQQGFVVAEVSPAINPLAVGDQDLPLAHRRRLAPDRYLHEPRSNRNDPAALLAVPRGLCLAWSKLDEIDPQFGVEATEQCYRVFCAALRLVRSTADAVQRGILSSQEIVNCDAERGAEAHDCRERQSPLAALSLRDGSWTSPWRAAPDRAD